ncbi:MAG: 30S ribosome-binding factor RbfA [Gemmatimonadales bacterium]|nr:30S ribosome-binding factor RbfA [Gemmatimonadales bacterium]NIN50187.1 30S ribosome-binding factor RbfA [Gemmatimonadales bacterium]NIP07651.1 30S ribosome-binding factor RbfA [Gemmatimonadales bacterium]NIR01803.1 30S ribosome-binding factor RbfA [Gemmatimonadales bacterium]NIS65706.1 30S ribosome-binding factor RbfA [Gemmatimonadales bacterium]
MTATRKHRPERIAALVQETLADALATQLKDPRVGFVTVMDVTVSPDCAHANIRVSVMGSDEEKAKAMEGLASARGYLRTYLARSLSLRTTPEIHFMLDRGIEHAARINQILDQLRNEAES